MHYDSALLTFYKDRKIIMKDIYMINGTPGYTAMGFVENLEENSDGKEEH